MNQEVIALSIVVAVGFALSWRSIRHGLSGPVAIFFLKTGHVKFAFWLRGLNLRKKK